MAETVVALIRDGIIVNTAVVESVDDEIVDAWRQQYDAVSRVDDLSAPAGIGYMWDGDRRRKPLPPEAPLDERPTVEEAIAADPALAELAPEAREAAAEIATRVADAMAAGELRRSDDATPASR